MSRENKTKTCRCGRGKLLTGEKSKYNAKDAQGRQICAICVWEAILAPYKKE
jgi:hypothetical protein